MLANMSDVYTPQNAIDNKTGSVLFQNWLVYISDCEEGKYGDSCAFICSCDSQNTVSCDKVYGNCTCKTGWKGVNCSENIDECTINSSVCPTNSICKDTAGSYSCDCLAGYSLAGGLCVGKYIVQFSVKNCSGILIFECSGN